MWLLNYPIYYLEIFDTIYKYLWMESYYISALININVYLTLFPSLISNLSF